MTQVAKYSFLPWMRQGIASQIVRVDNGSVASPAETRAKVKLKVSTKDHGSVEMDMSLIGPGDITGINPSAIVKVHPVHNTSEFEPNYLPFIEFYDEDFPWRYTPAKANGDKLRPWITLVVLRDDEIQSFTQGNGETPSVLTVYNSDSLPDLDNVWALAHVHVNEELSTSTSSAISSVSNIQKNNPDKAMARLLSSRKLQGNTQYHAFLVPTFEVGALAGLGIPSDGVDVMVTSWDGGEEFLALPVYYHWSFSTGAENSDFESLVTRLEARQVDLRVGARPMDITPATDLLKKFDSTYIPSVHTLNLEGSLKTDTTGRVDYPEADKEPLSNFLNLTDDLSSLTVNNEDLNHPYVNGGDLSEDPVIMPPIYGRWHALINKTYPANSGWVNELNLDPRERAAAGLGVKVVRENQELYMDYAWEQVGDVIEANRKICYAQFAREVSSKMFDKHIDKSLNRDRILRMTGDVHKKIKDDALSKTLQKEIQDSSLPVAAQNPGFRKALRPRGKVVKKIHSNLKETLGTNFTPIQLDINSKLNISEVIASEPKLIPNIALDSKMVQSAEFIIDDAIVGTEVVAEDKNTNIFEALRSFSEAAPLPPPPPAHIDLITDALIDGIKPITSVTKATLDEVPQTGFDDAMIEDPQVIRPIMAHPKLPFPMFEPLKKISADYIIPNIEFIQDNTISLLQTNQRFIEAYMVGLNHEMGRELLWRDYPTDQRGTYFSQFWEKTDNPDDTNIDDIFPINPNSNGEWGRNTSLGTHNPAGPIDKIVLLVRGEVLRKFPNVIIYAQKADWEYTSGGAIDTTKPRKLSTTVGIKYPVFKGSVEPDVTFLGFDLTLEEAKGGYPTNDNPNPDAGWFFILKERSGEIRFGLDNPDSSLPQSGTWDKLTWGHLSGEFINPLTPPSFTKDASETAQWGADSADMAYILYQSPVMVAFHASDMLSNFTI